MAAALLAAVAAPSAAFAQETTVVTAPYQPYWRVVAPSTDPQRPQNVVAGFSAVRGTVLHGEGDLLLVGFGDANELTVVRIPDTNALAAEAVQVGAELEAIGPADATPIFDATQIVITESSDS